MKIQHTRSKRPIIVTIVALFAVVGGVVGAQFMNQMDHGHTAQVAPYVEPVMPPPAPTVREEAAPETPTRIMIEKIGVDASIESVGLTKDGMMDDPNSNELVGWYDKSARLGEDKLSVLLDGYYGIGSDAAVLRRLPELQYGDKIVLHGTNGFQAHYEVVEREQQYTEDVDMKKALYPYSDGEQSLTIITCEGEYDPTRATYDKRTIIYAIRVK